MNKTSGFTLLEVLVALTLFAIVGGALLGLFQSGLRATSIGSEYTHAALLARSKLTELQVYSTLVPGVYEGEFDDEYRWRITLAERPQESGESLLRQVPLDASIEVSWGQDDNGRRVALDTVLLAEASPE
jgi:general secretion pathway protein I